MQKKKKATTETCTSSEAGEVSRVSPQVVARALACDDPPADQASDRVGDDLATINDLAVFLPKKCLKRRGKSATQTMLECWKVF